MNISTFFKILNRKIERYDKITSKNPFTTPQSIILIWVEEYTEHTQYKQAENN